MLYQGLLLNDLVIELEGQHVQYVNVSIVGRRK